MKRLDTNFHLRIDERKVLAETDQVRIIGRGLPGWEVELIVETRSKDAMGEPIWTYEESYEPREQEINVAFMALVSLLVLHTSGVYHRVSS